MSENLQAWWYGSNTKDGVSQKPWQNVGGNTAVPSIVRQLLRTLIAIVNRAVQDHRATIENLKSLDFFCVDSKNVSKSSLKKECIKRKSTTCRRAHALYACTVKTNVRDRIQRNVIASASSDCRQPKTQSVVVEGITMC